ncbi:MAG: dimethyl sulfoxide reductase anchor subunit [Gemmatimonadota bacterium]|nr:MAG: dimethyl sulfoxide reductase anchor subunit [Gemmatimonadota bacterium]
MASFPKSTYFRLQENCERRTDRYDPDYPLVLFVLFSRWSVGTGIVAGFLQAGNRFPQLVKISMGGSLILILIATLFSIFHLSDRLRFLAMIKNLRSQVSWEVLLAGVFTGLVAVDCLMLYVFNTFGLLRIISAILVIISGLLTLGSTGWAYKFVSHPLWNTNILSVYSIISGSLLGAATVFWIDAIFCSNMAGGAIRILLFAMALSLVFLFLTVLSYKRYAETIHDKASGGTFRDGEDRIPRWYILLTFILPFTFILGSTAAKEPLMIPATAILISLLSGILLERILFFSIENPNYMLHTLRKKTP